MNKSVFNITSNNKYLTQAFLADLETNKVPLHSPITVKKTDPYIQLNSSRDAVNCYDSDYIKGSEKYTAKYFTLPQDYQEALEYVINYFKKEPTYKIGDIVIASITNSRYIGKYRGIEPDGDINLDDWAVLADMQPTRSSQGCFSKIDRLATAEEIEKYNSSGLKEGDYLYIIKGTSWVKTNEVIKLGGEYFSRYPISTGDVSAITKAYPEGNSGVQFKDIQYRKATTEEANRFELSLLKKGDWVAKVWTYTRYKGDVDLFQLAKQDDEEMYRTAGGYYRNGKKIDDGERSYGVYDFNDKRCYVRKATQAEIDAVKPKNITLTLAGKDITVTKDSVRIAGHDIDMSSIRVLYGRFKSIDESSCAGYAVQLAIDVPIFKCGCQGVFSIQDLQKVLQAADSLS